MGIVFCYFYMLILIFFYVVSVNGDFMAASEFENLSENHANLVESLKTLIAKEEKTLVTLKRLLQNYEKEQVQFQNHKEKYFENPINCFKILKRLTTDLLFIDQAVNYRSAQNTNWIKLASKPPTSDELKQAAIGIWRVQDMYNLKVSELSEGKIRGVSYGHPMTGSDCFHLGFQLIDNKLYQDGIIWMQEALKKITNDEQPLYKEQILSLIDKSEQAIMQENLLKFEKEKETRIEVLNSTTKMSNQCIQQDNEEEIGVHDEFVYFTDLSYRRLCNGENLMPKYLRSRLKCRYLSQNHAFTKIGPLKVEELFLEPQILLVHDIITDVESEYLQEAAAVNMRSGMVGGIDEATFKFVNDTKTRATKIDWIPASDPVVAKIIRRGTYITGLNIDMEGDYIQVGNYGLGGHYLMHNDFFGVNEENVASYGIPEEDERVATVLYYLSDVELGGSTVFPILGVGMKPTKNQAIYWENLYPSGIGRVNTLHAACPVLLGSKWIATYWIRRKYQEFIRPCNLTLDDEDMRFYAVLN